VNWAYIKFFINSTIGTEEEKTLDEIIKEKLDELGGD
jgi:hypothetical protein